MAKADWPNWEIFVRDKFKCAYCGFDGRVSLLASHQMTIDHVRPRDKAGLNWDCADNKVVACGECNFIKRNWDGRYDATVFSEKSTYDIIASAWKSIQAHYQRWDRDYASIIQEIELGRCRNLLDDAS
jgi:hypothetical protein